MSCKWSGTGGKITVSPSQQDFPIVTKMTTQEIIEIKTKIYNVSIEELADLIEHALTIKDIRMSDINDTVEWIAKQNKSASTIKNVYNTLRR